MALRCGCYLLTILCACAARFTLFSVCLFVWHYRLKSGLSAIPTASELQEPEKIADFPEMTAFRRDGVKTSKKRDYT